MGKHWLSFDSIWYLRVSMELHPSLSPNLDPSAISCALRLPCPSGLCVPGSWIGSSLLFLKKTNMIDPLFDPQFCMGHMYESFWLLTWHLRGKEMVPSQCCRVSDYHRL